MKEGLLFCISGPSGVGKGTLVTELVRTDPTLALSVSMTTRRPRKGEKEGVHYFFRTREEFERGIRENAFIEYDEHFGNYYGTPKEYVFEKMREHVSVLLEIDVVGALNVKKVYGDRVVTVLIVPPTMGDLEERLRHRGSETEEQIAERKARVEYELAMAKDYDYVVVNDRFNDALDALRALIEKEKNKE